MTRTKNAELKVRLDEVTHHRLKMYCFMRGETMSGFAELAIETLLAIANKKLFLDEAAHIDKLPENYARTRANEFLEFVPVEDRSSAFEDILRNGDVRRQKAFSNYLRHLASNEGTDEDRLQYMTWKAI